MAASQGVGGVIACRLLIGFGEAMFGQVTSFYYSLWYTKQELAKRLAIFIGTGVVAGAFSGLIAVRISAFAKLLSAHYNFLIVWCCPHQQ